MRELLETVIKDSNKLKAKKRLDSRKDHSGFFDHRPCFFFEARGPSRGALIFRWHSGCLVLFARNSYLNSNQDNEPLGEIAYDGHPSVLNALALEGTRNVMRRFNRNTTLVATGS